MASYSLSKKRTKRKNDPNGPQPIAGPGQMVAQPTTVNRPRGEIDNIGAIDIFSKARQKARQTAGRGGSSPVTAAPRANPAATPYDVLKSPFKTQGDLDARARAIVEGQIRPKRDALNAQERQEAGVHNSRSQDIIAYGNWLNDKLSKSAANAATYMQGLQGNLQAVNSATTAGLASATGGAQAAQQAEQARLGGPGPADTQSQMLLNAALAATQNSTNNVNTTLGGLLAGSTEAVNQGSTFVTQTRLDEEARNLAALNELSAGRSALAAEESGLIPEAITGLEGQEMKRAELGLSKKQQDREFKLAKQQFGEQRANRLFQQYMAEQEFGLKSQNQSFQQWLAKSGLDLQRDQFGETVRSNRANEEINWANVGISQQQVANDQAKLAQDVKNAKKGEQKERAELRAKSYNTALEILNAYMAPGEYEYSGGSEVPEDLEEKGMVPYRADSRSFDTVVSKMQQAGVDKAIIYQILSKSEIPRWSQRAGRLLTDTRLRRRAKRQGLPEAGTGPQLNPHGTPAVKPAPLGSNPLRRPKKRNG